MPSQEETTLSIPSILIFLAILALIVRHFFFRGAAQSSYPGARSGSGGARNRVPDAQIDMVAGMFPQLARRDIEWDLRRNGGSVQATSERVLRTGSLDAAPPSFRPQTPPQQARPATEQGASASTTATQSKNPDLIARYNLSARLAETTGASAAAGDKGVWSASKSDRADALKRRREEMVLEARRRMIEREKGKARA